MSSARIRNTSSGKDEESKSEILNPKNEMMSNIWDFEFRDSDFQQAFQEKHFGTYSRC